MAVKLPPGSVTTCSGTAGNSLPSADTITSELPGKPVPYRVVTPIPLSGEMTKLGITVNAPSAEMGFVVMR